MTRRDRLRRVVILCASFMRNLAYYRAGIGEIGAPLRKSHSFWRQAHSNFIDICVLEWCKLFADRKGEHCWSLIAADPTTFEPALLAHLGMTAEAFQGLIEAMRRYRDKFVAHLDSDLVMNIPTLSAAEAAVRFYHEHIATREAVAGDLVNLPHTAGKMLRGYTQCFEEAEAIFFAARGRISEASGSSDSNGWSRQS